MKKVNSYFQQCYSKDGVVYGDTDSCYLSVAPFVDAWKKKTNNFNPTKEEVIKFIFTLDEKVLTPIINKTNDEALNRLNVMHKTMTMNRERICDRGIFVAKKKYILRDLVEDDAILAKHELTVKGIEIVRTSTPPIIRTELKNTVEFLMDHTNEDLFEHLKNIKEMFMQYKVEDIAFPRGVSDIKKYMQDGSWAKGTPIHVRAAILYNNKLKECLLKRKLKTWETGEVEDALKTLPQIKNGEKIKFIYLKTPNPIKENTIGWPAGYDLPVEFNIHKYIDKDIQYEKTFLAPLISIIEVLGWDITPKEKASIELF